MGLLLNLTDQDELDNFVLAFERAHERDGRAAISEFLPAPAHPLRAAVLRELVRIDLEYGWERGRPRDLDDYRRAYPDLRDDYTGMCEIAFEEFRLRRLAGQHPSPEDYRARFAVDTDDWASRCHDPAPGDAPRPPSAEAVRPAPPPLPVPFDPRATARPPAEGPRDPRPSDPRGTGSMPEVGTEFLGFRLVEELGRGAFGRVYLARQGDLADRPVVLKVCAQFFRESQTLAQLQHTNIVPIYSIHRAPPFQVICMPYLGATTLGDLLADLHREGSLPGSGASLLQTLKARKSSTRSGRDPVESGPGPGSGPGSDPSAPDATDAPPAQVPGRLHRAAEFTETLTMLEGMTYVQAILWVASHLADGLTHAHDRGILHRDLKPANILLSDEGQPMLLDFNLSADLKSGAGTAMAAVGGTLPYMSPEHLESFCGGGGAVDARSDLYSLGVVLFELLTGRAPFEVHAGPSLSLLPRMIGDRRKAPPGVRVWNQDVSPAVESIVRHCLEPDPAARYQSARELKTDLERQLSDRPLRHAPEPSARERAGKWARRHPTLCGTTSVALLCLALLAAAGGLAWGFATNLEEARAGLRLNAFRATFDECQLLLNTESGPAEHLGRGIALAAAALDSYGVAGPGAGLDGPMVRRLPEADRSALREELVELILLDAGARVLLAARSGSAGEHRRALARAVEWLDRAERIDPRPPSALYENRARFHALLGDDARAADDRARGARVAPETARDFYLLGVSELLRKRFEPAEAHLSRAVALAPRRFWAWYALGFCHADQGRQGEAAADFGVCAALSPGFAWPQFNRGVALARAGRLTEARIAYDRALTLRPDFAEALVNRGLTCLELGDRAKALGDLDRAVALGRLVPVARAEALAHLGRRAEAELAFAEAIRAAPGDPAPVVARGYSRLAHDPRGALADFARALALDPKGARARLGRAYVFRHDDPRAALAEAQRALELDPDYHDALELRALLRARLGDRTAEADVCRLVQTPTPRRLYNAACALAVLSRSTDQPHLVPGALDFLARAVDAGHPRSDLSADPDLDPLRAAPRFARLLLPPQGRPE